MDLNSLHCAPEEPTSTGASVELDWGGRGMPEQGEADRLAKHQLIVSGHGKIVSVRKGPLVGPREVVGEADLESLASAVRDPRRCCSSLPESIYLASEGTDHFDKELFDALPFHLEIGDDYVYVRTEVLTPQPIVSKDKYSTWLQRAVEPHGARVESVRFTDEYGLEPEEVVASWPEEFTEAKAAFLAEESSRPRRVEVLVAPEAPMKTADLLVAGEGAYLVLQALRGGSLDAHTAARIVRAGLPHVLIGVPECEWLEVKRDPYRLDAPRPTGTSQKIELAQDIARFANGDSDAVLLIGMSTNKAQGLDVVDRLCPAELATISPERYQKIIDARVYPTVEGLKIQSVDLGSGRGVLLIEVPAQPHEYKPFLVHGAIVGERVEGAFISIVRRRGEGSVTLGPSQIHAMLAAGRAYLDPNRRHLR